MHLKGLSLAVGIWLGMSEEAALAEGVRDIRDAYLLRSWDREDGLPDNQVEAVLQTRDGYLWVATPLGLARFDGARFTVFNRSNTPAMESQACYGLVEDYSGTLWVATTAGVLRRTQKGFEAVAGSARMRDWRLQSPANAGGVWATSDDGLHLYRLSQDGLSAVRLGAPFEGRVREVNERADGSLWLGDSQNLSRTTPEFTSTQVIRGLPPDTRPYLHRTVFEPDGACFNLLISYLKNEAQLYRTVDGTATLCATNIINNWGRPLFLVRDRAGTLWMPWGEGGLLQYAQGRTIPYKVPRTSWEDFVFCVFEDRDGNLWLGSGRSGLHCLQPRRVTTLTVRDGLPGATAECLLEAKDGSFWVGTEDGLTRFANDRVTTFSEKDGLTRRIVRALAEDEEGVLWVGTLGGLNYFQGEELRLHSLAGDWKHDKVRTLLPAKGGGVWVGTVSGLYRLAGGQQAKLTVTDGLSANDVLSLLEPSPGVLWVGTSGGGLNRLSWPGAAQTGGPGDETNKLAWLPRAVVSAWNTSNGLSNNFVRTLHQDADGVLWVGTDHGLHRYKDGSMLVLTTQHGLLENQVNALIEDDVAHLWIGGNQSLCRVLRRELNDAATGRAQSVSPVRYDQADGFPSLEISGQYSQPAMGRTRDGRFCFATSQGVAVLDPKNLPESPHPPTVIIEQLRANDEIVCDNGPFGVQEFPSVVHLSPGSARILEIQYTANTFVAPEKSRFKYRLAGWDKDWIDAGPGRKAYYANVAPGTYRFQVLAANKYGIWNEAGSSLTVQLAPFIYQTWWFYPVCGAILCLGLYYAVAWRINELRKIARLERQIALEQQRKRIARDLHDELGASLTQIAQLSEETRALLHPSKEAEIQTGRIAALAEEAVGNIGEIVWANNPRYDTLEDLVTYLREYAANYLSLVSLESDLLFPEEVPAYGVPGPFRRHLLAIVKEALQNVVKHAGAGRVQVALQLENEDLELTVRDNGCGMADGTRSRFGNGLANMRERIAELHGSCRIESKPDQGTTVFIRLPLLKLEPPASTN